MGSDQVIGSASSPWMATRVLTDSQGGPDVEVRMGIPTYVPSDDCWICPFQLAESSKEAVTEVGVGIDAFQAIIQALEGIRAGLTERGPTLCWFDFEPGFTGFTRSIPISFGLGLVRHLEAIVEREADEWSQQAVLAKGRRPGEKP